MLLLEILFWACALLVAYSYLIYPLILIALDRAFPPEPFITGDALPPVSVLIAAFNEEKVIRARVENCLALDYPKDKLEIIIASDGSDDGTNEIVREFSGQGVRLFDYEQRRGKVNVLNESVPRVSHDIVVFSDANTDFELDALKQIVPHFADDRVGSVCGRLSFVNADGSRTADLEGVYWRYETFLKTLEGKRGSLLGANGAIFAIRKPLFHHCEPDTLIEDFVMPMKILESGYRTIYVPEAQAWEEAALSVDDERGRRIRIGAGGYQAMGRLLPMLNPMRGFPALAYWSHKVLRWLCPFFLIALFGTNICLIGSGALSYNVALALQIAFYACAWIGWRHDRKRARVSKLASICYYFVAMNFSLLLGFRRHVMGTQQVKWQRTQR
jgi:cellulose synthase/poly-beta-1,6-N-acetylglucosamine synthase-like glycosyltransferase